MAETILLTGGSGRMGRELLKLDATIRAPRRVQLDVMNYSDCRWHCETYSPSIVIHAAALASVVECERRRIWADALNIAGTMNMLLAAASVGARFVYISTEYVFSGHSGNYRETVDPHPVSHYGWTKRQGELFALGYEKTLVVRAPFRQGPPWPYPKAIVDQWTSSRFPHQVAPDILEAARGEMTGIIHIGGPRISTIELARQVSPDVELMTLSDCLRDFGILLPADVSLNSEKWAKR